MGFGNTQKIVTSFSSEECLDIIKSGDSILSYNDDDLIIEDDYFEGISVYEKNEYVILVVGEIGTNINNWDIKTTTEQNIFTIEDGYKRIDKLNIGDILKHIDGLAVEVKTLTKVNLDMVEYSINSTKKNNNFFINGILFKI